MGAFIAYSDAFHEKIDVITATTKENHHYIMPYQSSQVRGDRCRTLVRQSKTHLTACSRNGHDLSPAAHL